MNENILAGVAAAAEEKDIHQKNEPSHQDRKETETFNSTRLGRLSLTRRALSDNQDESRTRRWNLRESYDLMEQSISLDDVSRGITSDNLLQSNSSERYRRRRCRGVITSKFQPRHLSFDEYHMSPRVAPKPSTYVVHTVTPPKSGQVTKDNKRPPLLISRSADRKTLVALAELSKKHSSTHLILPTRQHYSPRSQMLQRTHHTSSADGSEVSHAQPSYLLQLSRLVEGRVLNKQSVRRSGSCGVLETTVMAESTNSSVSSLNNPQSGKDGCWLLRILLFFVAFSCCTLGTFFIIAQTATASDSASLQALGLDNNLPAGQTTETGLTFYEDLSGRQKPPLLNALAELRSLPSAWTSDFVPFVSKCGDFVAKEFVEMASLWHNWLRTVSLKWRELHVENESTSRAITDELKQLLSVLRVDPRDHVFIMNVIVALRGIHSQRLRGVASPTILLPDVLPPSLEKVRSYDLVVRRVNSSEEDRSIARLNPAVYERMAPSWKASLVSENLPSAPSTGAATSIEVKSEPKESRNYNLHHGRVTFPFWRSNDRISLPFSNSQNQQMQQQGTLPASECLGVDLRPDQCTLVSRYRSCCRLLVGEDDDMFVDPSRSERTAGGDLLDQEDPFLQMPLIEVVAGFIKTIRETRRRAKRNRRTAKTGHKSRNSKHRRKAYVVYGLAIPL